jgi:carboxylesterase
LLASRRRSLVTARMLGQGQPEFFAPGRPPCVVAFHGFGGSAADLLPVLERVARAGYAVDAALLPGHGTRVEQLQDVTFDGWLAAGRDRVEQAAQRHGRVVLLGFSLGSLIAMHLATEMDATNGQAPTLAGLAVLGNAVRLRLHSSLPLGLFDRTRWTMPDLYLRKPRAGDLVDQSALPRLFAYDRHPMRSALEVYRAGVRTRAIAGYIACPTLVLHGRRDLVCHWKNAPWVADAVRAKDVSLRIYERSAHVLACDGEREEVGEEVAAFVGRMKG